MRNANSANPLPTVNNYECAVLQDPSAKAVTLLQSIEYHANEMLCIPNDNNGEVANHAACIIDLTELCIWLINIITPSREVDSNNNGMNISPLSASTQCIQKKFIPATIGNLIQLARENLGLTEADLARLLNTYSDYISDWECGTTEPPASMIIPLADALKCDPMWLLTGNVEEAQEA